jgi:hypothetical protein
MRRKKVRGSGLTEFIIVIPPLIFFLWFTWQIFDIGQAHVLCQKAARYIAWEKTDTTGGAGGSDPRPGAQVHNDATSLFNLSSLNYPSHPLNLSLEENDSTGGIADVLLTASVSGLDLNRKGLWTGGVTCYRRLSAADMLNQLVPGGAVIDEWYEVEEQCVLLTDAWNITSSNAYDQIRERMDGYWLIGPVDFTGGSVMELINEILNFSISLPWPFGDFTLCPEEPPRVNLESVPDRS